MTRSMNNTRPLVFAVILKTLLLSMGKLFNFLSHYSSDMVICRWSLNLRAISFSVLMAGLEENEFLAHILHYSDQKEGSDFELHSFVDELLSCKVQICECLDFQLTK